MKHQSKLEERVYLAYTSPHSPSLKEVRTGSHTRQEPGGRMQRPWRSAAYWLALHGLLNLLSYTTQDHSPRDDTAHSGLGPPH